MIKKVFIPESPNAERFQKELSSFEQNPEILSVMILAGAGTDYRPEDYNRILIDSALSIIGGIFEEILYNGKRYKRGMVIVGFSQNFNSLVLKDEMQTRVEASIENQFSGINPSLKTIFIFSDAFSQIKNKVLDGLYNCFGTMPNYIGGGAGSLEFKQFPCLFTNEGIIDKGVVIGCARLESSIGVSHGWSAISEPLKVTESKKNEIISLNWKPAGQVYAHIISEHCGKHYEERELNNIIQSYPFGVSKLDAEMVVRDPYKVIDNSIFTLDTIDQGSYVQVLYGNLESLLEGASRSKKRAEEDSDISNYELFLIDCISRVLFMGDEFNKELKRIDPDFLGFGALTLGEIANNGESYLEIYNKTSVVCHLDSGGT